MKTGTKVRRVRLSINQDNEFAILGIVSAEPDYKLSLILNRKLKMSLKNVSPVAVNNKQGDDLLFSRFSDVQVQSEISCDLVSNRSGKNYLIGKLKNIDYLFIVHNPDKEKDTDSLISDMKKTEGIITVLKIDSKSILREKYLQYLIQ
ncbi:MAG: IPExxxVDY family protein [Bacteroidales bacterium]|jgi:hypothetical protein